MKVTKKYEVTSDEIVQFIKNTGASVHRIHTPKGKKWEVVTGFSECRNKSLNLAVQEAMMDHNEAVEEGLTDAEWRK